MRYKERRRLYSQNFLVSPELVAKLIRNSSIGKNDLVLEAGPGKGAITRELIRNARKVCAIELDEKLVLYLKNKFRYAKNLEIANSDFLKFSLPKHPYKVFANLPFHITSDFVRKLTNDHNFTEGYLVVQKEFAQRVIGMPYDTKNTMFSVLLKPWFDISIFHKFARRDFIPFPHVDSVMIRINRLDHPLIEIKYKKLYENYTYYMYNKKRISYLKYDKFLELFSNFLRRNNRSEIEKVTKVASKMKVDQKRLTKIHRTRTAKNWRKF